MSDANTESTTASGGRPPVILPPPKSLTFGPRRVPLVEVREALEPGHGPEGYRLEVSDGRAGCGASTPAGLYRARTTLAQLQRDGLVSDALVEDEPDYSVRGFMLDISRDRVPSMETLRLLVDLMAGWKLNHLQLYTEHTYAYVDHETVWRDASPVTPDQLVELSGYCGERHIELSANQNCLGHMERWLCHAAYRPLGVTQHPYREPRGRTMFPSTLEPTDPRSRQLVRGLLAQLLPNFASPRVNVGLDEPWELRADRGQDYLEFASALRASPELDGREMLMWGDILAQHPELVGSLPPEVTVLEWGYEADHPFGPRAELLARRAGAFWVCPGTSSWNSVLGRWANARENCLNAAVAGIEFGASGYLVTDWGDNGHLQPLPITLPGLAAGAAAAWNSEDAASVDYIGALARVAVDDSGPLGGDRARALAVLGDAHLAVRPQVPNMVSVLAHLLFPRLRVGSGFTEGLDRGQLEDYEDRLDHGMNLAGRGPVSSLFAREIAHGVGLARLGAADARARLSGDGSLRSVSQPARAELAAMVGPLKESHARLWADRSRPGGLPDSLARLEHLERCYRSGQGLEFVAPWLGGDERSGDTPRART